MTIQDIKNILHAEILWADEEMLSHEVHTACGSDMMSDVLAYVKDQAVLLTAGDPYRRNDGYCLYCVCPG